MNKKNQIIEFCNGLGLLEVGFCSLQVFHELDPFLRERRESGLQNEFEEDNIEKRINPKLYMEEGKTIISVAFPYLFHKPNKEEIYFSTYTKGKDYHKVIGKYLDEVCKFVNELGGNSKYFVDSNALPERYIAVKSGIGFIGKNNMLINKRYGSYVFLGEIITDLDLQPDNVVKTKCGKCEKCLNACPTKSISKTKCNPNICLSYITQKKNIEDQWFEKFNGRMFGCDTCQKVCPFNEESEFSNLEEFKPFEFMDKLNLDELLNLDKAVFKEKYSLTSSGWRGKNILQRNALINAFMSDKYINKEEFHINSTYVKEYYHRLLKYNKL